MMGGAPGFSSAAFLFRLTALYVYLSPSNARLLFSPSFPLRLEEEVRAAHGRRRSLVRPSSFGLLAAHSFGWIGLD